MEPGTLSLWVAVVALVVSAYAATSARRSARAAERAAQAAEQTATVERNHEREHWIEKLAGALPDGGAVAGLLADLPVELRSRWSDLVASAAKRNPRTPPPRFAQLEAEFRETWAAAAAREGSR